MNISFTEKQANYIASQVESGDYRNASEVVREALRLHEVYRQRLIADLRVEIDKGWAGSTSSRSVRDILDAKTSDRA